MARLVPAIDVLDLTHDLRRSFWHTAAAWWVRIREFWYKPPPRRGAGSSRQNNGLGNGYASCRRSR